MVLSSLRDSFQCAFKQVIKSTAGQAGSGTQETDLTLLIAHWYQVFCNGPYPAMNPRAIF